MTLRLVCNTTDTPVPTDSAGHVLGGGAWGSVESTDDRTSGLLDSGVLREVDVPALDADLTGTVTEYRDAVLLHRHLLERADAARQLERSQLAELAEHDGPKGQLVVEVAQSDVTIPDPPKTSGRGRGTKES